LAGWGAFIIPPLSPASDENETDDDDDDECFCRGFDSYASIELPDDKLS
jgi:hypothetical protein